MSRALARLLMSTVDWGSKIVPCTHLSCMHFILLYKRDSALRLEVRGDLSAGFPQG